MKKFDISLREAAKELLLADDAVLEGSCTKDHIDNIVDTMADLGSMYAEKAKEALTPKQAQAAFSLAERAFKLLLEAKRTEKEVGPTATGKLECNLIDKVKGKVDRAQFYAFYLTLCESFKQKPMGRNKFFALCQTRGLAPRKIGGNIFLARVIEYSDITDLHR